MRWLLPVGATLASFLLYLLTLQPGLLGGDSAEAQVVPFVLGIFHYTGYPLYALLGKAWISLIPVGTVAYRMNLLSAATSALAVGGTAWIGRRLSGSWLAGLAAAAVLASSSLFWEWATRAGVRSLNATFVVAIFALAIFWSETPKEERVTGRRWLLLWFVLGLSQAHHRTTLLMLPVLVAYLVWTRPALLRDARAWFSAVAAMVPGLLFYLYLPIRGAAHPPYQFEPIDSLDHFLDLVLARGQIELMGSVPLPEIVDRLGLLGQFLIGQFTPLGVALALAGLVWLFLTRRREATFLFLTSVLVVAFTLTYGNEQFSLFYLLPLSVMFALGIGICLAQLVRIGNLLNQPRLGVLGTGLVLFLLAYLVIQLVPLGLAMRPAQEPPLDAYRTELRQEQALRLVHEPIPPSPGSMVVGEWEHIAAFFYSQLVDGSWKGAEFHYPLDDSLPDLVKKAWRQGRQVYITRAVPGLARVYILTMEGPLIHLLQSPMTSLPTTATAIDRVLDGGLALVGYERFATSLQPGQVLALTIYWQARQAIQVDYSVSARLLDKQGNIVSRADNEHPVLGSYPTSQWRPGSMVGDYYELPLGPQLDSGTYALGAVVYAREANDQFQNLRTLDTGEELIKFAEIQVGRRP